MGGVMFLRWVFRWDVAWSCHKHTCLRFHCMSLPLQLFEEHVFDCVACTLVSWESGLARASSSGSSCHYRHRRHASRHWLRCGLE